MTDTIPPSKRGRPRKFDRQRGIQTAKSLFWQHGYDGLGVAQLCSTLNITPTSLYGTYKNKFHLYQLALESYKHDYLEGLKSELDNCQNVPELFRSILEFSTRFYTKLPEQKGCMLLDSSNFCKEEKVVMLVSEEVTDLQTEISGKLKELEEDNAEEIASIIVTLLRGLSAEARSGKSEDDLFVTVEFFCATIGC